MLVERMLQSYPYYTDFYEHLIMWMQQIDCRMLLVEDCEEIVLIMLLAIACQLLVKQSVITYLWLNLGHAFVV